MDLQENETLFTNGIRVGSDANPAGLEGGSGTMTTTNKSDGTVRLRTDALPEVKKDGAAEFLGLDRHGWIKELSTLTANTTNTFYTRAPATGKITGIYRSFTTIPASAGGTVVAAVQNLNNASAHMLASGAEDNEASGGLSNLSGTDTAHSLTGTAASLLVTKGDLIRINIVSNNADMTGGVGGIYRFEYSHDN